MTNKLWNKQQAQKLFKKGYRGISNKFCIVARVDQNIREFVDQDKAKMRKQYGHKNWSEYGFLLRLSKEQAEDWFRRCLSKDKLTVLPEIYRELRRIA